MNEMTIERATEKDIPFLVEAIIHAGRSGSEVMSYQRIFDLTDEGLRTLITDMLESDIPNNSFSVHDFLILRVDGQDAGAACFWVEALEGIASNSIRASMLMYNVGMQRIEAKKEQLGMISAIEVEREKGALQIEWVYVRDGFRGKGVLEHLFREGIAMMHELHPFSKVQVISIRNNMTATKAFSKLGFSIVRQTQSDDAEAIRQILPGDGFNLWEKNIT